jgi:hypothetical protein
VKTYCIYLKYRLTMGYSKSQDSDKKSGCVE